MKASVTLSMEEWILVISSCEVLAELVEGPKADELRAVVKEMDDGFREAFARSPLGE